jgi:hypothetical protein
MDMADPKRANALKDKELANWMQSSSERVEPRREIPTNESEDPTRK